MFKIIIYVRWLLFYAVGYVLVIAQMFSNTRISQQFLFIIETQDQSGKM